jgi:hypothetical protein
MTMVWTSLPNVRFAPESDGPLHSITSSAREQLRRHVELDRSRSLEVDHKLELG